MTSKVKEYDFREKTNSVGFEIVTLDYFFNEHSSNERYSPHKINFHIILFITEGNGEHLIDFNTYKYQKNSILFVGKDKVHAWKKTNNVKGWLILFTEKFLHENQIKFKDISYTYPYNTTLYKPVIPLLETKSKQSFNSLFEYLFQEYYLPNSEVKQAILQNLLRTLLLKIQSFPSKEITDVNPESKELFIRFQRLLDINISKTRNANDYCKFLNVSYKKLNTTCKTLTNKTTKSFIDNYLIIMAKSYIVENDHTISEIAFMLGFDEVTNFTKYFKKHTKTTPKSFLHTITNPS